MAFALNRRALLKGALGSAVALPLLEAMFERQVYAQVVTAPKRYVFAYCGVPPCGEGVEDGTGMPDQHVIPDAPGALNAALKVGLEPLEQMGLKQDTTVISEMRIPRTGSGNGRRFGSGGFHYETMGPIVSGTSHLDSEFSRMARGPSSDWLLAQAVGSATPFPSLIYCVQADEHTNGYTLDFVSWRPNPNREPPWDPYAFRNDPIISPRTAFDQLFTNFTPPMTGQPPPPPDPELLRRKDTLARVQRAYNRLKPRLGEGDRKRLDQHLENVRALENRVAGFLLPPPMLPEGVCVVPTRPGPDPSAANSYADEDGRAASFVDLIHMAFACDLSRVVSFEMTGSMPGIVLPTSLGVVYRSWDGSPQPAVPLHEATHGGGDHLTVAETVRWHVKHLATLAKKLKDTPDVTGNMLDNTVIVLAFEAGLGDPAYGETPPHTSEGMAAIVIGGKSLGMQLGQHIKATGQHPASVLLTAMRAVGGSQMTALGEISQEIAGLRMG